MSFDYKTQKGTKTIEKTTICMRCGQLGHTTEQCKTKISSIELMRKELEELENEAIQYKTSEWKEDDMGLCIPVEKRLIQCDHTWKDGVFCSNCGLFGHTSEECAEPDFDTIDHMFAPYIKDKTNKAIEKKQQIIEALRKFDETHHQ